MVGRRKAVKAVGEKKPKEEAAKASGEKKLVGKVTHYYNKIGVAIVELSDSLVVGDKISIEGASTNVQQSVDSIQIEHKAVDSAGKGDGIGLKVADRCREGDNVYKIT